MKRGFTLVEIMIVVAVIAMLAALAIPNLVRARINANEASAQATLKTIATACEQYAAANDGDYPGSYAPLLSAVPAFINENYTNSSRNGYTFVCEFMQTGYDCAAQPVQMNYTGTKNFQITTGSVLSTF